MTPGRRSFSNEVTKNGQREHERLQWVSLENIGARFIDADCQGKEKLFFRIGDALFASSTMPLLRTHLNALIIVGGYEHFAPLFRVGVDTKIVDVVEDEGTQKVTYLGEHVEMRNLQVVHLGDDWEGRRNPFSQVFEKGVAFWQLGDVNFVFGGVFAQQGKKDVVKLEANASIMAELEDIECCAVSGSERDLGVITRVPIAIIIKSNWGIVATQIHVEFFGNRQLWSRKQEDVRIQRPRHHPNCPHMRKGSLTFEKQHSLGLMSRCLGCQIHHSLLLAE